jgi:hypothetical protein
VQGWGTPVASRLRLVSASMANEGDEASSMQGGGAPRWRFGAVAFSWTMVSSVGQTLAGCFHESRTTSSGRVFPSIQINKQVGGGWISMANCFRRCVRVEPAQIGAAATVLSSCSGLD